MTSTKYSVIIPVYNAESTIERCLNSLLNQIPENTELVIINDGSVDKSGEICQCYADCNSNIKYFEKNNGGVSSARNLGLKNVTGKYILFVDSDDYVSDEYWQIINNVIDKYQPDMLQFGFQEIGDTVKNRNTGNCVVFDQLTVVRKINQFMRDYMFSSLWCRVFKGDIIRNNNMCFDESLHIGEDQTFIFSYAMHMTSLVSISNALYCVVLDNLESLSRKRRDYLTEELICVSKRMFAALKNAQISEHLKKTIEASLTWVYYRSAYSSFREIKKYGYCTRERRKKIQEICNAYNNENIKPKDVSSGLIAIPVNYNMDVIIDVLISCKR